MNRAIKAAIFSSQSTNFFQRAAFFHSTPVLEHKRRNNWQAGKRHRRMRAKQDLLRNFNAYADVMFEGWKGGFHDDDGPSSSRGPSGSKNQQSKGSKKDRSRNKGFYYRGRRPFEFCEDIDDDIENIFRSAFGGSPFFYWSFINEEFPHSRSSRYSNNYEKSWSWRCRFDEDSDSWTESDSTEISDRDTIADRRALGLSASGPLTLEAVKTAYRACALKWHPDRHHGSSKAVAEEKFKHCNSAYQSLCDKLGLN